MKKKQEEDIDFVITWVDGSDEAWRKEKEKYIGNALDGDNDCRYRDWGLLKFWFRSVEQNAPWVRKIHFVTYGHLPDFLNIEHPKLNIVRHDSFIPQQYLPTFSSHPIEHNLHRIEGLSECFVYFNDDMYVNKYMEKKDFFIGGRPCYEALEGMLRPSHEIYFHVLMNTMSVINEKFDKRQVYKRNLSKWMNIRYGSGLMRNMCLLPWGYFGNIVNRHLAVPLLKSTMEEVWEDQYEILNQTCLNKSRTMKDISPYLYRYWALMKGDFVVRHNRGRAYHNVETNIKEIEKDIECGKHDMICLNDTLNIKDLEHVIESLQESFNRRYPEKSSFEKQ